MYYIYEIIGVKVGCTEDMVRRQKQQLSLGVMILLESHMDIEEASRRERELQAERGYRVDTGSYSHSVTNSRTVCQTPEAKAKRIANYDYSNPETIAKRVANTDFKARTLNTDYKAIVAKKDYKRIHSHRQRGIVVISPEGIRTQYSGMNEAVRQLTQSIGIKFDLGGISGCCSPKYPTLLTHKGYTFEYA